MNKEYAFISIPKNNKKSIEKVKILSKFPKFVLLVPAVLSVRGELQKMRKYAILLGGYL
jgi:hypothetical protein